MISTDNSKPRIMFLVSAEYDSLVEKDVLHMVTERDEGGFFSRVVTVHPFAHHTRKISINDTHTINEISVRDFPGAKDYRLFRFLWAPLHIIRTLWCLRSLCRQEQIDIVRATDPYWMGLLGIVLHCLEPQLRLCVSIHSDYDKRFQLDGSKGAPVVLGSRRMAKWIEKIVLHSANMVMPIRKSLGDYAVASGADRDSTLR